MQSIHQLQDQVIIDISGEIMSSSVLITMLEEVASEFINHLGRLKPDIAKHITIRVLSDSTAQRVIDEIDNPLEHTREDHWAPEYPFRKTDKEYLEELDHQNIMDQIDRQYE